MRTLLEHEEDCVGKMVEEMDVGAGHVTVLFTDNAAMVLVVESDDDDARLRVRHMLDSYEHVTYGLCAPEERARVLEELNAKARENQRRVDMAQLKRIIDTYPQEAREVYERLASSGGASTEVPAGPSDSTRSPGQGA